MNDIIFNIDWKRQKMLCSRCKWAVYVYLEWIDAHCVECDLKVGAIYSSKNRV